MVCSGITKDGLSKSKVEPSLICCLKVKASFNFLFLEQEDKLCDEVDKVKMIAYLGGRVSAGGGCEAALTVSTR